jgi:hypothetical protein
VILSQLLPALSRIRIFSALGLLAVTLTSCAAPAKVSDQKDPNAKKIEYVYYTPTGSSIPIRVPKESVTLTDSEVASQQKALEALQRTDTIAAPSSPSGK